MLESRRPSEDPLQTYVKCEIGTDGQTLYHVNETDFNFSTGADADSRRGKLSRQDPMSHRIIEKRRRDRMNNCLAELSRLIPPDYLKKGRGRIEKTEIIEMAIKHLKFLQERANCVEQRENGPISAEHFRLGYQECLSEVMRYLVEGQGHFPRDTVCVQLINHLQRHCDNIMKGDVLNKPRCNPDSNSSSSGSSSNYMIHNQIPIPNNVQRILVKTLDSMNNSERHHQHSNVFSGQNEDKPIINNNEMEHSRLAPGSIDDSPEEINEPRDIYIEPNMSQMPIIHNGNFPGLKLVEGNVDEGGGRNHTEFLRKVIPEISDNVENDCQTIQDLRVPNHSYSPLSPSYQHSFSGYRSHCEQTLRNIRKGVSSQIGDSGLSLSSAQEVDNIHSYKYKNTIKQRFSQSQSTDYLSSSPSDLINYSNRDDHSFNRREQFSVNSKSSHKKRKISDHQSRHSNSCYDSNQYKDQSSSETNSSENISSVSQNTMFRSNKLQEGDLSSGRISREKEYLKLNQHIPVRHVNPDEGFSKLARVGVPIFALHAKGSFYVPLNVDYDTLIPFLGHYDLLDVSALQQNISLHPVTISVNFQPKFFNSKHVPSLRTKSEHKLWQ